MGRALTFDEAKEIGLDVMARLKVRARKKRDIAEKISGSKFRGTILGAFETLEGNWSVVVELADSGGVLHIFDPSQLNVVDAPRT